MVLRSKGMAWFGLVLAMAVGCGAVEDNGLPPEPQEAAALQGINLGYGADLFYYLRHNPSSGNFSTFGTISTSGRWSIGSASV